jgi:hypothetical protein
MNMHNLLVSSSLFLISFYSVCLPLLFNARVIGEFNSRLSEPTEERKSSLKFIVPKHSRNSSPLASFTSLSSYLFIRALWSCSRSLTSSLSSHIFPHSIMRTSVLVAASAGTIVTGLLGKNPSPLNLATISESSI